MFKKDEDDEVQETEGCLIEWKDGKDLTKKKIKKKQKNKKTGETRTIIKTIPADSFFNMFETRKAPEEAVPEDEQDSDFDLLMDRLHEASHAIDDLYDLYMGQAVEYYLNVVERMEEPEDMDEDDMDEDDDDDDVAKGKGKKKGKDSDSDEE